MNRTLIVTALSLILSTTVVRAEDAAPAKIATVDMQKTIQTVDAGKKAKATLEKEFNAKKAEFQKEEASIKKMGEEFKKQSLVMNDEARMKKQQEIQERIMKFQGETARSQEEIQKKELDMTKPLVEKIKGVIAELAKKKGYTVVLEKNENMVLFSPTQDDLTDEVISAFNQKHKG